MAIIQGGVRASGQAEVVDGHLQVSQEHTPPGFVPVAFVAVNFTATTAEGLVSLTPYRSHVAGTAATSHAVTAGKKLKLTHASLITRNAGAVQQVCLAFLRVNPTGAVVAATPAVVSQLAVTAPGALAGQAGSDDRTFEDHMVFSGTEQIGVTQLGTSTAGNHLLLRGFEFTE